MQQGNSSAWRVAAAFAAGVALTIPVMLVAGGDDPAANAEASPTTTIARTAPTDLEQHATTTTADTASTADLSVEETDLNANETSIGTLRWTRVSGDVDSLPAGQIQFAPEGNYVAIETGRRWWSDDGVSWASEPITGFGDVQDVWIEENWAIGWEHSSGTSGDLEMSRLFEKNDNGWTEIDLPEPTLPDINGIVWSAAVSMPVEQRDTTVIHVAAYGMIPWGDHYGVSEVPCGSELCERGPLGHIEQDDLWTIVPASGGSAIAEVSMTVVDSSLEFVDTETGELVHVIESTDSMSAQQISDKLIAGSMNVSGTFVRDSVGPFEFHESSSGLFGQVFSVPDGGFAALEIEGSGPGSIDASVWTSDDGITWTDRGAPSFLSESAEWITIEQRDEKLVAQMIVDSGSASGEETFETFESTDGIDWTANGPSPFPPFTQFHETNFGQVATAMPQSQHLFWISLDGENWEEVQGPPGPHMPYGGGMSAAGAAGDILWAVVAEDGGSRTLWVGTLDD